MEIIKKPDRAFWWEVAASCEYATFFQSPLWNELVCRSYDYRRDASIGAVLESGTRVVLPLVEAPAGRGVFKTLESTWNWSPGGIIADGPVGDEDVRRIYGSLDSLRLGEGVFTGNPHSPLSDPPILQGWTQQEEFSQVLPLEGDVDSIVAGYARGHRQAYRGGLRAGVKIRKATALEDYEAHYQSYQASHKRWKSTWGAPLPWRLFETCYEMSVRYPENITLWIAEVHGRFAAGAIAFSWNRILVGWHAAAHQEFFKLSPNHVLHTEITRDALDRGMSCYDFNPSGGHEGVAQFKAGFGAEKQLFSRVVYSNRLLSAVRGLAQRISRQS